MLVVQGDLDRLTSGFLTTGCATRCLGLGRHGNRIYLACAEGLPELCIHILLAQAADVVLL